MTANSLHVSRVCSERYSAVDGEHEINAVVAIAFDVHFSDTCTCIMLRVRVD